MKTVYTIPGKVPSLKNQKQIAYNARTKRPFILSNPKVIQWTEQALYHLGTRNTPFPDRVSMKIMFYVPDNRSRDLTNMTQTVEDALVKANILRDDSWQWLKISSLDAKIDRLNPRAVITIVDV